MANGVAKAFAAGLQGGSRAASTGSSPFALTQVLLSALQRQKAQEARALERAAKQERFEKLFDLEERRFEAERDQAEKEFGLRPEAKQEASVAARNRMLSSLGSLILGMGPGPARTRLEKIFESTLGANLRDLGIPVPTTDETGGGGGGGGPGVGGEGGAGAPEAAAEGISLEGGLGLGLGSAAATALARQALRSVPGFLGSLARASRGARLPGLAGLGVFGASQLGPPLLSALGLSGGGGADEIAAADQAVDDAVEGAGSTEEALDNLAGLAQAGGIGTAAGVAGEGARRAIRKKVIQEVLSMSKADLARALGKSGVSSPVVTAGKMRRLAEKGKMPISVLSKRARDTILKSIGRSLLRSSWPIMVADIAINSVAEPILASILAPPPEDRLSQQSRDEITVARLIAKQQFGADSLTELEPDELQALRQILPEAVEVLRSRRRDLRAANRPTTLEAMDALDVGGQTLR